MRHTETTMPKIGGRVLRAALAAVLAIGLMPAIVSPAKAYAETTPTVSIGNGTIESDDQTEVTVPVHLEFDSCNVTNLDIVIAKVDGLSLKSVDGSGVGLEMVAGGSSYYRARYYSASATPVAAHSGDVVLTFTFTTAQDYALSFHATKLSSYTTEGTVIKFTNGDSGKISYNIGPSYIITYTDASGSQATAKLAEGKKLIVNGVESTPSADITVPAPAVPDEYLTYGYSAEKDADGNLVLSPAGTRKFDFTVNSDGTTATITKCNATGAVAIPESVSDANGTYAVTATADLAHNGEITSISVPGCIRALPYGFAQDCVNLISVILAEGTTSIAGSFCAGCTKLEGITVPDTVRTIGSNFLGGCTAATHVELGSGVSSVASSFCSGCTALAQVELKGTAAPTFSGISHFASVAGPLTITVQNGTVASAMDAVAKCVDGIVAAGGTYTIDNLAPAARLSTAAGDLQVGTTFTVDIVVKGDSLASSEGTFSFDAEAFELVKAEAAEGIDNFEYTASTGKWSFYGNEESTTAGLKVATVTLKCIAMKDGAEVCVRDCVAGKSGVTGDIELEAGSLTLDVMGAYKAVGDINDNGRINIVDAQVVLDMANNVFGDGFAGLLSQLAAAGTAWNATTAAFVADVNADGEVSALDARAIQVYAHTGSFTEAA